MKKYFYFAVVLFLFNLTSSAQNQQTDYRNCDSLDFNRLFPPSIPDTLYVKHCSGNLNINNGTAVFELLPKYKDLKLIVSNYCSRPKREQSLFYNSTCYLKIGGDFCAEYRTPKKHLVFVTTTIPPKSPMQQPLPKN